MKQLTDRQKAAIYDDAARELRHRIKVIDSEDVIQKSMYNSGYTDGAVQAYKQSLELLTAPDVVDYSKRTWKDTAYNILGYGCLLGAFALLYFGVKFTLELYGLI